MNAVHSVPAIPALVLVALTVGVGACDATADVWSVEADLVLPDRSLKAHQPGPGLSLRWERPLAPHWWTTASTGYLTLLTKHTPSYQMVPIQGGVRWALRAKGHGPYLATDLGLFITVESFRFLFAGTSVTDDDAALYWGPGVTFGYLTSRLEGGVTYQLLLPRASDARFFRIKLGYRF